MKIRIIAFFILIGQMLPVHSEAQWMVRNYALGYGIFEMDAVGSNPTTIAPLLKQPVAYQAYLNTINFNSLDGHPAPMTLHTFYLNSELQNQNPLFRFWKKWTIQLGIMLTARITHPSGGLAYESWLSSPDPDVYSYRYSLTNKLQFLGVNLGANRRFNIAGRMRFLTGFRMQESAAITNYYTQVWDSSRSTPSAGLIRTRTKMFNLKGKNFFQWQVMIPLAFEYDLKRDRLVIRLEADLGIVGSRFRSKDLASSEAHGAGIWLIYRPRPRPDSSNKDDASIHIRQ